jgi:hypothetical protein
VIRVSLSTVKDAASMAPNRTAVAPVKFRPLITTDVPPAAGRVFGTMLLINGPAQLSGGGNCVTAAPHGGGIYGLLRDLFFPWSCSFRRRGNPVGAIGQFRDYNL